jgi:antitoxin HigA-1
LGKFFELNPSFWIGLQNDYDLRAEENKLKKEIKSIKSYKKIINKKLKSKAVA